MFAKQLDWGQAGESAIARWLRKRGNTVLPVYEKIIDNGKGPRLFMPDRVLIAPDLLVLRTQDAYWVEAKRKRAFTWHRITRQWVTGIDLHHYRDYCQVDECSPFPVWLLFLQEDGQAKDSPGNSPTGLFGNRLSILKRCVHHTHSNWGSSGMVYWDVSALRFLATLKDVE